MSSLESINFSFSSSPLIIIIGALIIGIYVYYIYKYTVPKVSLTLKYFLFAARFLALLLILFILFEPILSLEYLETEKAKNLIFIDNSKSIVAEDSAERAGYLNEFTERIKNIPQDAVEYFFFGSNSQPISIDSIDYLDNSEPFTNISQIFEFIKSLKTNVGSIVLVSDGILTEGSNPVYSVENLGIPVFTVGIGDSTDKIDIIAQKLLHNEYIYSEKKSSIEAVISQSGFNNKRVFVEFNEDGKRVAQEEIVLSESGINRVKFDFQPQTPGEKKITISVSSIPGEATSLNNTISEYVNVLDKKVNVLLISGSPSSDLSFVKNSLSLDENISVESLIHIAKGKYFEGRKELSKIDSADVIFFIGFPSKFSDGDIIQKVKDELSKGKPFFLVLASGTDLQILKTFNSFLPFSITSFTNDFTQVQPEIIDINNSLIKSNSSDWIRTWNNLPPIEQPRFFIQPKPESEVIARSKFKGIPTSTPLIISRSVRKSRSIAIIAKNIWKWKLHADSPSDNIFDNFIKNSVEWLNVDSANPQVIVKTLKKVYTLGETIEFTAQVYDENFNPIVDADLQVTASKNGSSYNINMSSVGNGIYEGYLESVEKGIYNFSGIAQLGNKSIGESKGRFEVSSIEVEKINLKMDSGLLRLIANVSGGQYFSIKDSDELFNTLKIINENDVIENSTTTEINLWSDSRLLILIIILLGIEWFFRKRSGML